MTESVDIYTTTERRVRVAAERRAGVWALHASTGTDRDVYTITHVPTGLAAVVRLPRLEAERVLATLAQHWPDWERSAAAGRQLWAPDGMKRAIALAGGAL